MIHTGTELNDVMFNKCIPPNINEVNTMDLKAELVYLNSLKIKCLKIISSIIAVNKQLNPDKIK